MATVLTKVDTLVYPASLGLIQPGATFATASAPLTQNITPVGPDGVTKDLMCQEILVQALLTNGALIYICNTSAQPDTSAYTNVVCFLQPGDTFPRLKEWSNKFNLGTLWVGALNSADGAVASFSRF